MARRRATVTARGERGEASRVGSDVMAILETPEGNQVVAQMDADGYYVVHAGTSLALEVIATGRAGHPT